MVASGAEEIRVVDVMYRVSVVRDLKPWFGNKIDGFMDDRKHTIEVRIAGIDEMRDTALHEVWHAASQECGMKKALGHREEKFTERMVPALKHIFDTTRWTYRGKLLLPRFDEGEA